jgi:hypothetical protein
MLITAAVALLAPGVTYETAAGPAPRRGNNGCHGGDNDSSSSSRLPGRHAGAAPGGRLHHQSEPVQGGHLRWHRSAGGSVCIGTVIMWVQYNTAAARTWRVIVYSARHPGGLTVASRTFTSSGAGTGGASEYTGPSRSCPRCA